MNFLLTSCFQTKLVSFSEVSNITQKKGQQIIQVGSSTENTCCCVHQHLYEMWEVEIVSRYQLFESMEESFKSLSYVPLGTAFSILIYNFSNFALWERGSWSSLALGVTSVLVLQKQKNSWLFSYFYKKYISHQGFIGSTDDVGQFLGSVTCSAYPKY